LLRCLETEFNGSTGRERERDRERERLKGRWGKRERKMESIHIYLM
jgi:hypothetical protein